MVKGMVSIVVPVYNVEKFLPDCLLSIENQTYRNFEVIFINDGSTDGSKKILEEFCAKHSYARLINQENKGSSEARSTGFANVFGEYVYMLDSDDMIHPKTIEILLNALIENNADFSCGFNKKCVETKKYSDVKWQKIKKVKSLLVAKNNLINFIANQKFGSNWSCQVKIIKTKTLEQTINFPKFKLDSYSLGEDYYLISMLINFCEKAVLVKQKLHLYRQRQTSLMHESKFNLKDLNLLNVPNIYLEFKQRTIEEIKTINAMKAFHAIVIMKRMNNTKYFKKDDFNYVYKIYKSNLKYFYYLKFHPFYFIFLPLTIIHYSLLRKKFYRKDKE